MESLDRVFDVLGKERRRYALYYLDQADGPVHIDELAERISEWESESAVVPEEKFEDVFLALRHNHLPKAARAEYVEYDPEQNVVEITGEPPEFQIVLSVGEALERPSDGDTIHPGSFSSDDFFTRMAED